MTADFGFEVCDAHHHLWDHPDDRFLVPDLVSAIGAMPVTTTVFIECGSHYRADGPQAFRSVGETEFVVDSDPNSLVAGIVGFADLRTPELTDVLAAHVEAGRGRFRGVRHATAWDSAAGVPCAPNSGPDIHEDTAFRTGLATLGAAGLSYDAFVYHPQLRQFAALARAVPDVPIVLNHLGAPLGIGPYLGHRPEVLLDWRAALEEVASCDNVSLKLGGVGMFLLGEVPRAGDRATPAELVAHWSEPVRFGIELFGVERCMFESNFPVDRSTATYVDLWTSFLMMVADFSPSEQQSLFAGTALRTYRLERRP
jgi:L-fuconolactonase